jgi:CII-binding regulator of phage lambda lysogenization HflD
MKKIKDSFKFFIIFIFISNTIASEYPNRILFVGNSYLYYNDSIHNHVKRLLMAGLREVESWRSNVNGEWPGTLVLTGKK